MQVARGNSGAALGELESCIGFVFVLYWISSIGICWVGAGCWATGEQSRRVSVCRPYTHGGWRNPRAVGITAYFIAFVESSVTRCALSSTPPRSPPLSSPAAACVAVRAHRHPAVAGRSTAASLPRARRCGLRAGAHGQCKPHVTSKSLR